MRPDQAIIQKVIADRHGVYLMFLNDRGYGIHNGRSLQISGKKVTQNFLGCFVKWAHNERVISTNIRKNNGCSSAGERPENHSTFEINPSGNNNLKSVVTSVYKYPGRVSRNF